MHVISVYLRVAAMAFPRSCLPTSPHRVSLRSAIAAVVSCRSLRSRRKLRSLGWMGEGRIRWGTLVVLFPKKLKMCRCTQHSWKNRLGETQGF